MHYESNTIRLGHGVSSYDGRWFVSDSQEPGKNELVLLNLETGKARVLCWPNSSVTAGHDSQAHVHPSFSPKGNYVCYTSDRTGTPQVYVVPIGDICNSDQAFEAGELSLADDFESGMLAGFWRSGGEGHGRYEEGAVSITDEVSRTGRYAVRMDVGDGFIAQDDGEGSYTERTELDSRKHSLLGQTINISYSLMIPEDFPIVDTRLVISQVKQSGVSVGPLLAQRFRDDRHYLTIRKLKGASKQQLKFELPDLIPGEWHDFRIQMKFSSQQDGFASFWMDGDQLVSFKGRTAHPRGKNKFYHKTGMYRDHLDQPMTLYMDDYVLNNSH